MNYVLLLLMETRGRTEYNRRRRRKRTNKRTNKEGEKEKETNRKQQGGKQTPGA